MDYDGHFIHYFFLYMDFRLNAVYIFYTMFKFICTVIMTVSHMFVKNFSIYIKVIDIFSIVLKSLFLF
jgi:hypothetical protein